MFSPLRLPSLFIIFAGLLISCGGVSGPKVSRDYLEVFYKDGATEADAQRTLNYLYPLWKSDSVNADAKSIMLTKSGDTMNFKMVTNPATLTDADYVKIYQTANEFSKSLYGGAPVNIYLTNPEFKTERVLHYKESSTTDYGRKSVSGNIEVYSPEDFSEDLAIKLAQYLDQHDNSAVVKSFRLDKDAGGTFILQMVINKGPAQPIVDSDFYALAKVLSEQVFSGSGVSLELTDNAFNAFKTLSFPVDTTKVEPVVED